MSVTFDFKHSVKDVIKVMTDPGFQIERGLALGDLEVDCKVEKRGDDVVLRMTRRTPVELNAFLAKFFGSIQDTVVVETWRRDGANWVGASDVQIKGQPVTMSAAISLKANGKGSRYEITHDCKVGIPIVGGKIAKEALARADQRVIDELELAREKLG